MKKGIIAVITGVVAAGMLLTACGGKNMTETPKNSSGTAAGSGIIVPSGEDGGGAVVGGWAAAEPGKSHLSEEEAAIFDQAAGTLLGVDYTPILVLATQLVSGTNYAFLCSGKVVAPDTQPGWKIMTVYADLNGNVSVTNVSDIDLGGIYIMDAAETGAAVGAWQLREPSEEMTVLEDQDAQAAFEQAAEGYVGVGLKPLALLGTQLVSGTNYKVLCYGTMVTANPVSSLYIADVYADLNGNAEFSNVQLFDLMRYIDTIETVE